MFPPINKENKLFIRMNTPLFNSYTLGSLLEDKIRRRQALIYAT